MPAGWPHLLGKPSCRAKIAREMGRTAADAEILQKPLPKTQPDLARPMSQEGCPCAVGLAQNPCPRERLVPSETKLATWLEEVASSVAQKPWPWAWQTFYTQEGARALRRY